MEWDEDAPRHYKKRAKKKPFAILTRYTGGCIVQLWPSWAEWHVYRRYATEKDRDKALAALQRKARFCEYKAGE